MHPFYHIGFYIAVILPFTVSLYLFYPEIKHFIRHLLIRHPKHFAQYSEPEGNKEDWQQCSCGAWHYIGNIKHKEREWCPMCNGFLRLRRL